MPQKFFLWFLGFLRCYWNFWIDLPLGNSEIRDIILEHLRYISAHTYRIGLKTKISKHCHEYKTFQDFASSSKAISKVSLFWHTYGQIEASVNSATEIFYWCCIFDVSDFLHKRILHGKFKSKNFSGTVGYMWKAVPLKFFGSAIEIFGFWNFWYQIRLRKKSKSSDSESRIFGEVSSLFNRNGTRSQAHFGNFSRHRTSAISY